MKALRLDGENLNLDRLIQVARQRRPVALAPDAGRRLQESRKRVDRILEEGLPTYGISTGFGELSRVFIGPEENGQLQKNLILSHASAVGSPLSEEVVRAMLLLRLNTLLRGFSGVSPAVVERLVLFLNENVVPVVPEQGSLGASGDLANLAHMALALIGEGEVFYDGLQTSTTTVLKRLGLKPLELSGKDGLALINGTQLITAVGSLALHDARVLLDTANVSLALTMEALCGISAAYLPEVHRLRPHPGQAVIARRVLALLEGSQRIDSRAHDVQDAYTLRCAPQVHGASLDALDYIEKTLVIEMNAVNDNPLVLEDGRVISGGHFHGQPLALALDLLGIAVAELASMAERRVERLVNPQLSGLPAFLTKTGGVSSGYMIPQYVAAALVSENKTLAHPASVDSIPSSANKEDHVSMGAWAARKAARIVENTRRVLAIELMVAAQAIDLADSTAERPLGRGTARHYRTVRKAVAPLINDRPPAPDIEALTALIAEGAFRDRERRIT